MIIYTLKRNFYSDSSKIPSSIYLGQIWFGELIFNQQNIIIGVKNQQMILQANQNYLQSINIFQKHNMMLVYDDYYQNKLRMFDLSNIPTIELKPASFDDQQFSFRSQSYWIQDQDQNKNKIITLQKYHHLINKAQNNYDLTDEEKYQINFFDSNFKFISSIQLNDFFSTQGDLIQIIGQPTQFLLRSKIDTQQYLRIFDSKEEKVLQSWQIRDQTNIILDFEKSSVNTQQAVFYYEKTYYACFAIFFRYKNQDDIDKQNYGIECVFFKMGDTNVSYIKFENPTSIPKQLYQSVFYSSSQNEIIGFMTSGRYIRWKIKDLKLVQEEPYIIQNCQKSALFQPFYIEEEKALIVDCEQSLVLIKVYDVDQQQIVILDKVIPQLIGYQYIKQNENMILITVHEFAKIYIHDLKNIYQNINNSYSYPLIFQDKNTILSTLLIPPYTLYIFFNDRVTRVNLQICLDSSQSNLFKFILNRCLETCQKEYYFQIKEQFGDVTLFGLGTEKDPFISSEKIIIANLEVGQLVSIYPITSKLDMKIYMMKGAPFLFKEGYFSVKQPNQNIEMSIQSLVQQDSENQTLKLVNNLFITNFSKFQMRNLNIIIDPPENESDLKDFQYLIIENSFPKSYISSPQSGTYVMACSYYFHDTNAEVSNISLEKVSFQNINSVGQIFSIDGTNRNKLLVNKFTIKNCQIDNLRILNDKKQSNLIMNELVIKDNYCKNKNSELNSVLFSSSSFTINSAQISNNQFCNDTVMFLSNTINFQDDQNKYLNHSLTNITFEDNIIYYTNQRIFFSNLQFYQQSNMETKVVLNNIKIQRNSHINLNEATQTQTLQTYFYFNNINQLNISDINFQNQNYVSLIVGNYVENVTVTNFNCTNDKQNDKIDDGCCLKFTQVSNIEIDKMNIINKHPNGIHLIDIQNSNYFKLSFMCKNSNFISNIIEKQEQYKSSANIFMIINKQSGIFNFENVLFDLNQLNAKPDLVLLSTGGIFIDSPISEVKLISSKFYNLTTSSILSHMHITASDINITNCKFFTQKIYQSQKAIVEKQEIQLLGGMMKLFVQNLYIVKTNFDDTRAAIGGFIYATSLSNTNITIFISECKFSNSEATDSSIIHIVSLSSNEKLEIQKSSFTNIVSYSQSKSTAIQLNKDSQVSSSTLDVKLEDVRFKNIKGNKDASIFSLLNAKIKAETIKYESLESFTVQGYQETIEDACLFTLQKSYLNLTDLTMNNLKQINYPLLLQQDQYNYTEIKNVNINEIIFSQYGLIQTSTNLTLNDFKIKNCILSYNKLEYTALIIVEQSLNEPYKNLFSASDLKIEKVEAKSSNLIAILLQNTGVVIKDSLLQQINGSGISIRNPSDKCSIDKVTFYKIGYQEPKDSNYGALQILLEQNNNGCNESKLSIMNSIIKNSSSYIGGGLNVQSDCDKNTKQIDLYNLTFENNVAQIGGAYFIQGIIVNETTADNKISTNYTNNKAALYGRDGFQYPTYIQLIVSDALRELDYQYDNKEQWLKIYNITSGSVLPELKFQIFDNNRELIKFADDQILYNNTDQRQLNIFIDTDYHINDYEKYYIQGQNQVDQNKTDNYSFTFKNLQYIAVFNKTGKININHFLINQNFSKNNQQIPKKFSVFIDVTECNLGQIQVKTIGTLLICRQCTSNTYTFDKEQCHNCPDGAECPGGSQMILNSGYWRDSPLSSTIVSCDEGSRFCVGGIAGNDLCREGHIGPICEECDLFGVRNGVSYSRSGVQDCYRCNHLTPNVVVVLISNTFLLVQQFIMLRSDISYRKAKSKFYNSQQVKKSETNTSSTLAVKEEQLNKNLSVYLKILMNYIQLVTIIRNFQINIPITLISLPQALSRPVDHAVNTMDCWIKDWEVDLPFIYFRLFISCVFPIIYYLFSMLIYFVYLSIKKEKPKKYVFSSSILFLFLYLQPNMIEKTIGIIACRKIGGESYIAENLLYQCNTDSYKRYSYTVGISLFFFFILIVPGTLLIILAKSRHKLKVEDFLLQFGYLYSEYKESKFYWEFVKMYKKIMTIVVFSFFSQDITIKGFIVISDRIKPFNVPDNNYLDQLSCKIAVITILIGLFINKNPYTYQIIIGFIIIGGFNILFFYWIGKRIAYEYKVLITKFYKMMKQYYYKLKMKFCKKKQNSEVKQGPESSQNIGLDKDDQPQSNNNNQSDILSGIVQGPKSNHQIQDIKFNITTSKSIQTPRVQRNTIQYHNKSEFSKEKQQIEIKKSKSSTCLNITDQIPKYLQNQHNLTQLDFNQLPKSQNNIQKNTHHQNAESHTQNEDLIQLDDDYENYYDDEDESSEQTQKNIYLAQRPKSTFNIPSIYDKQFKKQSSQVNKQNNQKEPYSTPEIQLQEIRINLDFKIDSKTNTPMIRIGTPNQNSNKRMNNKSSFSSQSKLDSSERGSDQFCYPSPKSQVITMNDTTKGDDNKGFLFTESNQQIEKFKKLSKSISNLNTENSNSEYEMKPNVPYTLKDTQQMRKNQIQHRKLSDENEEESNQKNRK